MSVSENSPERIQVIVRPGKDDWIGVAYSSAVERNDIIREYVRPQPTTRAMLEYDQFLSVDAWRCFNCGAHTYDEHKFEIPAFCCRCGQKFSEHDYNGKLERHTQ